MKILHTADWHIGQFKGPVVDGVNLRSQDTVKCLEYMVQVAIEEKPDIVCVSGDIFHQEQVGPVRYSDEMITATNIITSLAHSSKYVIVMRGTPNHDGAAQFRVLERMLLNIRNVDVVTEPGVIKTPWADIPIYQEVLNYNGRSNGMIKILLSKKLGEMRLTQADLARTTGIRPNTINELYHELADRVNLEHLDLICEALDCELDELIVRVPNKESAITHTRQGTQKPGRKR